MKTFYMLYSPVNAGVLRRIDDETEAKREAARDSSDSRREVYLLKAVEVYRQPVPQAEVTKLED